MDSFCLSDRQTIDRFLTNFVCHLITVDRYLSKNCQLSTDKHVGQKVKKLATVARFVNR